MTSSAPFRRPVRECCLCGRRARRKFTWYWGYIYLCANERACMERRLKADAERFKGMEVPW